MKPATNHIASSARGAAVPSSPPKSPLGGTMVGLGMLALASGLFYQSLSFQEPSVVTGESSVDVTEDLRRQNHTQFWNAEAIPLLEETRMKDQAALKRAKTSLEAQFTKYAEGSPKFADSLTGWGTRFKILYRTGVETLEGKEEMTWTQQLIQEKFATHVVSQAQLEKDLLGIGQQFAFELAGNRNELLASIETKLTAADLTADLQSLNQAPFQQQFQTKLSTLLKEMPSSSVKIGVGSLAAGIAAEEAVRQIIRVVVAELAVRLAATAVAAGGTAGAAAATGAGGGTVVAPGVGTAIGFVGGFVVGAFVDWKMTDKFEEKVELQVREFLSHMLATLRDDPKGLLNNLAKQSTESEQLYQRALHEMIVLP